MQDRKSIMPVTSSNEISVTPQCFFNQVDAKPSNVIFLDIDGVLLKNSRGILNRDAYEDNISFIRSKLGDDYKRLGKCDLGATLLFSRDAVNNLKFLCQKSNAKIVISSNWRIDEDERKEESLAKLRGLLKLWDLNSLIIDQTPHCGWRSDEIKAWLKKNKVDNFLILDNVDHGLSENFPKNFINTGDSGLFTEHHLNDALAILGLEVYALKPSSGILG